MYQLRRNESSVNIFQSGHLEISHDEKIICFCQMKGDTVQNFQIIICVVTKPYIILSTGHTKFLMIQPVSLKAGGKTFE